MKILLKKLPIKRAIYLQTQIITYCAENQPELLNRRKHFPKHIFPAENRGRDIPFIDILGAFYRLIRLINQDTQQKASHRADGTSWRQDVYEKLLNARIGINIIDKFRKDSKLGSFKDRLGCRF